MTDFSFQLYSARNFGPLADILTMLAERRLQGRSRAMAASTSDPGRLPQPAGRRTALPCRPAISASTCSKATPRRRCRDRRDARHQAVYCPHPRADKRPTDEAGWRAFAARWPRSGEDVPRRGLRSSAGTTIDFEFEALSRRHAADDIILMAAPDLAWEADVAWIVRGGADPLAWIDRYGDRITAVHVKDIAPAGEPRTRTAGPMSATARSTGGAHEGAEGPDPSRHLRHGARQSVRREPLRAPLDRLPPGAAEDRHEGKDSWRRHHRLRQHLGGLSAPCAAVQGHRGRAPAPISPPRRPRARGRGIRRSRARASSELLGPARSTSSST